MQTSSMSLLTRTIDHFQLDKTLLVVELKKCGHCQASKDVLDFSADTSRGDGLRGWCKVCEAEARSRRYKRRKEADLEGNSSKRRHTEHIQATHHLHDDLQGTFPAFSQQQQQQLALLEAQQYHPMHHHPYGSLSDVTAAHSQGTAAAVRQERLGAWGSQAAEAAHGQSPDLEAQAVGAWAQQDAMAETPHLASRLAWAQQTRRQVSGHQLLQVPKQLGLVQEDPRLMPAPNMALERRSAFVPVRQSLQQSNHLSQHTTVQREGASQRHGQMPASHRAVVKSSPYARRGSPNTSDSELSALESLTDMKRCTGEQHLVSPARVWNSSAANGAPVSGSTSVIEPAAAPTCRLTLALSNAVQHRYAGRAASMGGPEQGAGGSQHVAAGLWRRSQDVSHPHGTRVPSQHQQPAQQQQQQHRVMEGVRAGAGRPGAQGVMPSHPGALGVMTSHPGAPALGRAALSDPRMRSQPPPRLPQAVHQGTAGAVFLSAPIGGALVHPAIGSLLGTRPSYTSLSGGTFAARDSQGVQDKEGAPLGSRLASHSDVAEQHTWQQPGYQGAYSVAASQGRQPSTGLRTGSSHVYRPVPTMGAHLNGARHASACVEAPHCSNSPAEIGAMTTTLTPVTATAAQNAEGAAWLAQVSLLLLAVRAIGFARQPLRH